MIMIPAKTTLVAVAATAALLMSPSPSFAQDVCEPFQDGADRGDTLSRVRDRGALCCGTAGYITGFSLFDTGEGLDLDYCRAVAAAVLGDPDAIAFVSLSAAERFVALNNGTVDVLSRNTTHTVGRDTALGLSFAPITFYDGQGFMVRVATGIETLEGLAGHTVCVQANTTTTANLDDLAQTIALIKLEFPTDFPEDEFPRDQYPGVFEVYAAGFCDSWTTDKSALAALGTLLYDPENHAILDATISKEPLGMVTRHGDDQWSDIVRWTVYALIAAEEKGVTSKSAPGDRGKVGGDAELRRLLGSEGDLGAWLGLESSWAYDAIRAVGNSGEIYDRNLGPNTPTAIPRGLNALYTDGGLLYSPPFR
jgi:general L-amino acid transport system substrate-binding protein